MQHYRVKAHSAADPRTIYSLLIDGMTWPAWMPIDSVDLEQENALAKPTNQPEQVGDVRIIRTGKYVNREKIVQLIPERKFSYVILDGMLHDYKGDVELTPAPTGGTEIEWHGVFRMSIPGAAWLMRLYLTRFQ